MQEKENEYNLISIKSYIHVKGFQLEFYRIDDALIFGTEIILDNWHNS